MIIVVIGILDQATKLWALDFLAERRSVEVLGDFFRLTLVYNYGGAMGTAFGSSTTYLVVACLIFPLLLFYIWYNRHEPILSIPLALIAGGAIGNITDRIRLGKVVDFLDVDFFNIAIGSWTLDRWWTFNLADSAITCGIVFILITMFLPQTKHHGLGSRPNRDRAGTAEPPDSAAGATGS